MTEHSKHLAHPVRFTKLISSWFRNEINIQFEIPPDTFQGVDMMLGASLFLSGPSQAEGHCIPYRHILFSPQALPSREHPPPIIPFTYKNRLLNKYLWKFQRSFFNKLLLSSINKHRKKLGLKPIPDVLDSITQNEILVASDYTLAPVPQDVALPFVQTGNWRLSSSEELSNELQHFLVSGVPPVYLGFGSMIEPDPGRTTRMLLEAVQSTGLRAVISRGWAQLGGVNLPANCCIADNAPHSLLFPRTAVIVHHGGAGTVFTAAQAGIPQIIIPYLLDQYYWADRLYHLGISPRPIKRSNLSAKRLASAIKMCITDRTMQKRARQIANTLQNTQGVEAAVSYLESTLNRLHPLSDNDY